MIRGLPIALWFAVIADIEQGRRVSTFDDPGGPLERDTEGRWLMPWLVPVPHAGTPRRSKRHAAAFVLGGAFVRP